MNSENGKLKPEDISRNVIDFLGTDEARKVFGVDLSTLSKYKSLDIDGGDNHRKSPFEKVRDITGAIRIEIEDGNTERKEAGQKMLEQIGSYIARLCRGVFLPEKMYQEWKEFFNNTHFLL